GLGEALFSDWRYLPDGTPNPEFVLNRPEARGAEVLVAGHNFGCGSSREHAPWALRGYGFRAVVSTYFADIFRNNALKNGLLPITLAPDAHRRLMALAADPAAEVTVDLASQTVTFPDGETASFPIDPFARHCLLNGLDQLAFLLGSEDAIARYEAEHPARIDTTTAAA
ncbi:MAG TPA: 3-isopropylmalate dehydratase small subunit, partial [Longimicrobium sp.]|nr:3-isopropylmalate dehydratase small subunit [Longimicrobium sp.]